MEKTAIGSARERTRTRRVWRGVATATAACALAGGAVLAVAVPSHAQDNNLHVTLINVVNHQCLQDNGFAGGTDNPVVTQPCSKGHENQIWVISASFFGSTPTAFGNEATSLCLQSASSQGGPNSLHTQSCSGAADELWVAEPVSGDTAEIVNQETHLCLGSDASGNAYTHTCDSSHRQLWTGFVFHHAKIDPSPTAGS
jgi:hypothetical protein